MLIGCRLAVAACLARFKGASRDHTDSDLRCYLAWRAGRGLDRPLDAGPYTFVSGTALVLKVREGGRVVNVHALLATMPMADRNPSRVADFGAGQRRSSGRPLMSTGPATRTWRTKTNPSAGCPAASCSLRYSR